MVALFLISFLYTFIFWPVSLPFNFSFFRFPSNFERKSKEEKEEEED